MSEAVAIKKSVSLTINSWDEIFLSAGKIYTALWFNATAVFLDDSIPSTYRSTENQNLDSQQEVAYFGLSGQLGVAYLWKTFNPPLSIPPRLN